MEENSLTGDSTDRRSLERSVLAANAPQLISSFLYLGWNNIFTTMVTEREWSTFGSERKSLRVSSKPCGEQRGTYFLQLPYRYSLPLIGISILLHWLVSQTIFIVAIERRASIQDELEWGLVTCGFSVVAGVFMLATYSVLPASALILGRRYLPSNMPIIQASSFVISVACHHPDGKPHPEAAWTYLKWGVMREKGIDSLRSRGIAHCGFSADDVDEPQDGVLYA